MFISSITINNLYDQQNIAINDHQKDLFKPCKLELDNILQQWLKVSTSKLDFKAQKKLYKNTEILLNKLEKLPKEEQHKFQKKALNLFTHYSTKSWETSAKWIGYHNEAYPSFSKLITFCASSQDKDSEDIIPEDVHQAVLHHMENNPYQLSKLPSELLQHIFFIHPTAEIILRHAAKAKGLSKSINIQPENIKKLIINPINTKTNSRLKLLGTTPQLKTLKFTNSRKIDITWLSSLPSIKSLNVDDVRDLNFLKDLKNDLLKLKLSKIYKQNLDQLCRFTSLDTLKLHNGYELQDVDFLSNLGQLDILEISNAKKVKNFDSIAHLFNLTVLNLRKTEIKNLNFLKELKKLKHLDISECRYITNIESLKDCTSLETLNLALCVGIENFEVLTNLPSLKKVNLLGCQISKEIPNSLKEKGVLTDCAQISHS